MRISAHFLPNLPRSRPTTRIPTVCVVDPKADDYQAWQATADASGVRLQMVARAEEALRFARTTTVDLWVVNTALPGLSGYELCEMLKARTPDVPVYLVTDEYSPEAERGAWQARATLFGCKGVHAAWISQWLKLRRLNAATVADRSYASLPVYG